MQVKLSKHFEVDSQVKNFDHSKFSVYTDNGAYITNVYKHDGVFYTLFDSTAYETIEDCVKSIKNHVKIKEHEKKRERRKGFKQ